MQIQSHKSKKRKLGQLIKIQKFVLKELESLLYKEIKKDFGRKENDDKK